VIPTARRPLDIPRRLLWVEGKDDSAVVQSLCSSHGLPQSFAVRATGGIELILGGLPLELRAAQLDRLGIVVDANGDARARWAAIRDILHGEGYPAASLEPDANGLIVRGSRFLPRFGVWIMPDNTGTGMVEDFAARLIPSDDSLWPLVRSAVDGIPTAERRFPEVRRSKAEIHTWLAWQEYPGSPMGQAITKGDLDGEAPLARRFVDWLRRLMIDEDATP
jgi:hypothetical protein